MSHNGMASIKKKGIKFVYAQKVKRIYYSKGKVKSLPQQAEVAQG